MQLKTEATIAIIEKDVKKAAGSVEKIKRVNNSLQIEDDLSFWWTEW